MTGLDGPLAGLRTRDAFSLFLIGVISSINGQEYKMGVGGVQFAPKKVQPHVFVNHLFKR